MRGRSFVGIALTVAMLCSAVSAADIKSGPQPGSRIPGAFHCMQVKNADNPKWDGTSQCLV